MPGYIRLRFDGALDHTLEKKLLELQTEWKGEFFSQLDPRAGLGCHPLHVTVLGGLRDCYPDDDQVQGALDVVVGRTNWRIKFRPLKWEASGAGSIKLVVQSVGESFQRLQAELEARLPRGSVWVARGGGFHITCGTFMGTAARRSAFLQQCPQANGEMECGTIEYENDKGTPNPPSLALSRPSMELTDEQLNTAWHTAYTLVREEGTLHHRIIEELSRQLPEAKMRAWLNRSCEKGYTMLHQCAWHMRLDPEGGVLLALGARPSLRNYRQETAAETQARRMQETGAGTAAVPAAPVALTHSAGEALLGEVSGLCRQLDGTTVALRCHQEHWGSTVRPCDAGALLKLVTPIHDKLRAAFEEEHARCLQWLDRDTNAYANGCAQVDPRVRWVSKLHDLHATVSSGREFSRCVESGQVAHVPLSAVKQAHPFYRSSERHRGHADSASPLLCYREHATKAWITLHLDPAILVKLGLRPKDDWYFHISLAKLEYKGKGQGKGKGKG